MSELARRRPAVPAPVARQLRQEAGFGCCKCGLPIYEYHHIKPYTAADPHFRAEDMMLLCPTDHHEATSGAMTEAEQRQYKSNPSNRARGYVDGMLKINQTYAAISFGANQFVGDGAFVKVDDDELLRLDLKQSGRLELSLAVYDKGDELLALIEKNEWITGDPLPWDIESKFQRLTIRRKAGDIVLSVDARSRLMEVRADLWRKGQNIRIQPSAISLSGVVQNAGFVNLCFVAMGIKIDTVAGQAEIVPDARYGQGAFVSWPDVTERVRRGVVKWLGIKYGTSFEGAKRNDLCPCGSGRKFKRCHLDEMP